MNISLKQKNIITSILLVASVVLIALSLWYSRDGQRKFEYEVGRPWLHPRLEADFPFDIQLDEATQKRITDSINEHFANIYTLDRKRGEQQQALLTHALKGVPGGASLLQAVEQLYADGIVDNDAADDIRAGKQMRISVGNNQLQVVDTRSMRTVRQAYEWLTDTLASNAQVQAALKSVDVSQYLKPNMKLDEEENEKWKGEDLNNALRSPGTVQANEVIITRGEIVTPHKASILKSYEHELTERFNKRTEAQHKRGMLAHWFNLPTRVWRLLGQIIIVTLLMLVFYYFMRLMRPRVFANMRRMVFLITFITLFTIAVFLLVKFKSNMLYLIPFAIVPIIVSTFFDSRTSFFVHMVVVLMCSLVAGKQAEFIIMQFLAGDIAIASMQGLTRRSQLVRCALLIFLAYCISFTALTLVSDGGFDRDDAQYFIYFAINCIILSFAYFLIFLVEKIFGFTSSMTLVELSDINSPLLRKLSNSCPGTFQHSLQVANLAGEAALKIGANLQLARAGSLYHDIGKIKNPAFFTENQIGENPHNSLPPETSAKIVIEHVANGLRLADDAKLPSVIKDLIAQHHGKSITRYFYSQACKAHPDETIDKAPYSYPGPNPQTKEAAILMMADACEAAAKSLTEHSEEAIKSLVEKIIDGQIADGLLKEAPISFKDVETIKQLFIDRLRTFYHRRVSYPDDVKPTASASKTAATPPPYQGKRADDEAAQ